MTAIAKLPLPEPIANMFNYFLMTVLSPWGLFAFLILVGLMIINRVALGLKGILIILVIWLVGLFFCYFNDYEHYIFFAFQALLMFGLFVFIMIRNVAMR